MGDDTVFAGSPEGTLGTNDPIKLWF